MKELGRLTPDAETNSRVTPVLPASSFWYWYSSPAEPAPAAFVPPSTDVAIGPLGYVRTDEFCTTIPGKFRADEPAAGVQVQLVVQDDVPVVALDSSATSRLTGTWTSADIACASRWGWVI